MYRQLGKSSLQVSRIGFGCMSLHPDTPDHERIIHMAVDLGINYFDTADLYDQGANEILLGKAIRGKRNRLIIATKVGNEWNSQTKTSKWNPSRPYILEAVDRSLQRLRTDHIDLYQLHGGTIEDPIEETISAFEQLQKAGKIIAYGISSIRPNVVREWSARSSMSSLMTPYSLLDRRAEKELLPLATQKEIAVLARGTLAQGLLAGKPSKEYLGHSAATVDQAIKTIRNLAEGRSAAQMAIQFGLQHPAIASAVVGFRTVDQLEDVAGALSNPISNTTYEQLRNALPVLQFTDHL